MSKRAKVLLSVSLTLVYTVGVLTVSVVTHYYLGLLGLLMCLPFSLVILQTITQDSKEAK